MTAGVVTTLLIYISSGLLMAFVPSVAAGVVNLATVAIGSIASFISLYAVGQSAVDWKINSNLNSNMESKTEKVLKEVKFHEMQYDDVDPIDYSKLK